MRDHAGTAVGAPGRRINRRCRPHSTSPGSEESILLPSLEEAARVAARRFDSFLVEVYRGLNLEPEQRIEITGPAQHEIGAAEQKLQLEFIPMPGLRVNVRHMPGFGLIWPAAILLIIGAAGYVLPPAFTLVQIAPWPAARAADRRRPC